MLPVNLMRELVEPSTHGTVVTLMFVGGVGQSVTLIVPEATGLSCTVTNQECAPAVTSNFCPAKSVT
jgi:hypothetical protein